MSEYWKSLPRKFCDICKCWFADNKASIDFHEKGKRHQENVKKRINELQKKGLKEYEEQKNLENEMKKIEQAALKAFKKDLQRNPELAAKYQIKASADVKQVKEKTIDDKEKEEEKKTVENGITPADSRLWYEAISDEGHVYFWNTETSESTWEAPEEGYLTLAEQKKLQEAEVQIAEKGERNDEADDNDDNEIAADAIGPKPKPDPYGQWIRVENKIEEAVDLQLPEKSDDIIEVVIPLTKEPTRIKFQEKTVDHLDDSLSTENSGFKKRKNISGIKRNVRQRFKDDD